MRELEKDWVYVVLGVSLVVNLILGWSHYKFMKMVVETPAQKEECSIEWAFEEVGEGEKAFCKGYRVFRRGETIVVER